MNDIIQYLDNLWSHLKEEEIGVMHKVEGINAPIYLMASDGTISLLFTVPKKQDIDLELRSYENINLNIIPLSDELKAITITLLNERLYSIFLNITANIIKSLYHCPNNDEALKTFIAKLYQWRKIFDKKYERLLSPNEQLGLYGELCFIKELLSNNFSPSTIISSWIGPLKSDKDFIIGSNAVEVKSTFKTDKLVKISNLNQLNEIGYNNLYLYHYIFAKSNKGNNTLPQIINELRSQLESTFAADDFEEKLLFAGYFNEDAVNYQTNYTPINEDCYLVCGDFPRLTPNNIMSNILNAEYIVDLNTAQNHLATYQDFIKTLKI